MGLAASLEEAPPQRLGSEKLGRPTAKSLLQGLPSFQPRLCLNSPFVNRSARRGRAPSPEPGADRWPWSSSEAEGWAGRQGPRMAGTCLLDTGEAG